MVTVVDLVIYFYYEDISLEMSFPSILLSVLLSVLPSVLPSICIVFLTAFRFFLPALMKASFYSSLVCEIAPEVLPFQGLETLLSVTQKNTFMFLRTLYIYGDD